MAQASLESLFERFRQRGESSALAEVFDRTSPDLLRLALHLVREMDTAEDALQATFLTAIDRAASWDSARPLEPWLIGILVRQAAMARRRERRALEPWRVGEERSSDPADEAAFEELSERLGELLAGLPPMYGDVLRRNLQHGESPSEIARALERAPGTVRMQLYRGLELLRKALPTSYAAAALRTTSVRGLADVRAIVMAHAGRSMAPAQPAAPTSPVPSAPASAGPSPATSSTAVSTLAPLAGKLLSVVAAAALAGWAWHASRERPLEQPESLALNVSAGAPDIVERSQAVQRSAAAPPSIRDAPALSVLEVPRPAGPWLRGRVEFAVAPVAGRTRVWAKALARERELAATELSTWAGVDGRFELDVGPLLALQAARGGAYALDLGADHAHFLPARTRVEVTELTGAAATTATSERVLRLEPARVVSGVVLEHGSALNMARVAALRVEGGRPLGPALDEALCEADGSFALRVPPAQELFLVAASESGAIASARLGPAGSSTALQIQLESQPMLRGLARVGSDHAAGARVEFQALESQSALAACGVRLAFDGARLVRLQASTLVGADGAFEFRDVQSGPCQVRIANLASGAQLDPRLFPAQRLDLPQDLARPLELSVEASQARVRVGDRQRASLGEGARAWVLASPPADEEREIRPDVRGDFWVASLANSSVTLRGEYPGRESREETLQLGPAGSVSEIALELSSVASSGTASLNLRLTMPPLLPGEPEFDSATLELYPLDGQVAGEQARMETALNLPVANGELLASALPAGRWRARLLLGGAWRHWTSYLQPAEFELNLSAGSTHERALTLARGGRLRIDCRDERGAPLAARCTLQDLQGTTLAVHFIARETTGLRLHSDYLSGRGPCDVAPQLAPGLYDVTLEHGQRAGVRRRVQIEAGRTLELEVVLR